MSDRDRLAAVADRARGHLPESVLALAAGVGAVAGSFLAVGRVPSNVVAPVADVVVAATPAVFIRYSILLLGDLGDRLAFGLALAATVGLFAVGVAGARAAARRAGYPGVGAAAGGIAALGVAFALVGGTPAAVSSTGAAAAGATLPLVIAALARAGGEGSTAGRRAALGSIAAAIGMTAAGAVLGGRDAAEPTTDEPQSTVAPIEPTPTDEQTADEESTATPAPSALDRLADAAAARSLDVKGLESLISERFYVVDVSQIDPDVDPDGWSLTVSGAVESETTYSFGDIRSRQAYHRFESLRCVGERLNGEKMDNALWTGVPLRPLVEAAGIAAESCCVVLRAADGFYEEFPLDALDGSLLAFGMNGRGLPRSHGAPARALIPGHWGEINVKWLTDIEVKQKEVKGYWEKRGWHGTGPVNTVAKLHAVNRLDDGRIEVGGHAYAGTRGIRTVEVSTDGGTTWTEATLSEPLPGEVAAGAEPPVIEGAATDALRQWVHRYDAPGGAHEVVVRAVDGTGTLQPKERSNAFPSGPTGWVSKTVDP